MSKPMSPAQAAQIANVSRRTIMRAIDILELKATRDNRNHWKIAPEDLHAWTDAHTTPSGHMPINAHPKTIQETLETSKLRTENAHLREKLFIAETDRDDWREIAKQLARNPDPKIKRLKWWPW